MRSIVFASLPLFVLACSSSSSSPAPEPDTGLVADSTPADGASNDTGTIVTNESGADTAGACWLTNQSRAGCNDCLRNACKNEAIAAYGADWTNGNFSGVCKDYATCLCGCDETDNFCASTCNVNATSDCDTAKNTLNNCIATNCADTCPT